MRQTIYIRSTPTQARFSLSSGGTRKDAQDYFSARVQYQNQGRLLVTTASACGGTTCLLHPDKDRMIGHPSLRGALHSNGMLLGNVEIPCALPGPPIEVKTASMRLYLEGASIPGTYEHIAADDLGHLVEIARLEPSFKELWHSRLGFGLVTWGALLPRVDRLAPDVIPALHFTLAAHEFIIGARRSD